MDPRDSQPSQDWAIASVASVGAIVNWYPCDLVNRTSGRAHRLDVVVATALATPIPTVSTSPPGYLNFRTRKSVRFSDFDGVGARVTSLNAGIIYGYGLTFLTLFEGSAYLTPVLASVCMSGMAIMLPGGSAAAHGVATVSYGVGVPMGTPSMLLPSPDEFPLTPRSVHWSRIPSGPKRISAPSDLLFDFDRSDLKPGAITALREIEYLLSLRTTDKVHIHGYTDAIGAPAHNDPLSLRRAQAVRLWLIRRKVFGAETFAVHGHGALTPAAPNEIAGHDNPEGRALNRRVTILYD